MDRRPYATPEGVRTYLVSLDGLHALREDRRQAAARFERMPAYCVLGCHVLTEDGRFGDLTGHALMRGLEDVVALEDLDARGRKIYGEAWRLSYRTPGALAPAEGLCPECGRGWTFAQRSDAVEVHDLRTVLLGMREDVPVTGRVARVVSLHAACLEAMRARDDLWDAERAVIGAGFPDDADPVPCAAPPDGFGPWFRLETPFGAIRFGPRGRGYGIDWTETLIDLSGRFCRIENLSPFGPIWNEPPVPHGPFHVDPKDEAWFHRYLGRLRMALGL